MPVQIALVNPPVYDFTAYDYWLKPYGLLAVAGQLRSRAQLTLFDYLDRLHPHAASLSLRRDEWGRGAFASKRLATPAALEDVPRHFSRFGLPRRLFHNFLQANPAPDFALVQSVMTYWYPGVSEVIADLRRFWPQTKIVLGGVYATLCPAHAGSLGADLVIRGQDLDPLWSLLQVTPDRAALPYWEGYPALDVGVMKITDGCPFRCTYCSVPQTNPAFSHQSLERTCRQFEFLVQRGARHVAFYDDALLHRADEILVPFLERVAAAGHDISFHTPNALNARFLTDDLAATMVAAGFRTFYLGFESGAYDWQHKTGGKVYSDELTRAIHHLERAGADLDEVCAYLIVGHPHSATQEVETAIRFAHGHGIRVMLSDFSPIPGTPDGEACREWIDLDEPLNHNKTSFPIRFLGRDRVADLKGLALELNQRLPLDCGRNAVLSTGPARSLGLTR